MTSGSAPICPICKHPIASPMDAVGFPRSIELDTCRVPEMSEAVTHYNCVFGLMKFNDLVLDIIDFYKQLHPQRDRIKVADRNVIYYIKDAHDLRVILLNSYVRCSMPPDKAPDFVTDLQALYMGKPATKTGFCSPSPHPAATEGAFAKRRNILLHFSKDLTTLSPQGIRIERSLDFVDVRALEKLLPDFAAMAESAKAMNAFQRSATQPSPAHGTATAGPQIPRVTRMIGRNIVSGQSPLGQALQRIQQGMAESPNDPKAEPYMPPSTVGGAAGIGASPRPASPNPGASPGGSGFHAAMPAPGRPGSGQSGSRMAVPAPIPHPAQAHQPVAPIPHPGQNAPNARMPNPIPHPTAPVQHLAHIPAIPPPSPAMPNVPQVGATMHPPLADGRTTPAQGPAYAHAFESHVGSSPRTPAVPVGSNSRVPAVPVDEPVDAATIGVVTVSDRASAGQYEDLGGPAVAAFLEEVLVSPFHTVRALIPDEREQLRNVLVRLCDKDKCCLILTTGGTGPAERDITPEVTEEICDKMLPGFGEEMRRVSLQYVPTAILSRQVAGVRGKTLIINLPGRPKSIRECLMAIFAAVPYCVDLIEGPRLDTNPGVVKAFRPEKK